MKVLIKESTSPSPIADVATNPERYSMPPIQGDDMNRARLDVLLYEFRARVVLDILKDTGENVHEASTEIDDPAAGEYLGYWLDEQPIGSPENIVFEYHDEQGGWDELTKCTIDGVQFVKVAGGDSGGGYPLFWYFIRGSWGERMKEVDENGSLAFIINEEGLK